MKIKKYGHACVLVEDGGVKVIVDPGNWNPVPDATGVAAVLITHEHQDHMDTGQVKAIVSNNPGVRVITHEAAGKALTDAGIEWEKIESGDIVDVNGLSIESTGIEHAPIYVTSPCRNTGFRIGDLFVPGDAIHDVPKGAVRVLLLPTGGPWMKISEAIDYAKKVKPEIVVPIHDAMYTDTYRAAMPHFIGGMLKEDGIEFRPLEAGAEIEL